MNRLVSLRLRLLAALSLVTLIFMVNGCMGPLLTAMYLAGAADVKAEYDGLKKKKVVVVCQTMTDLKYGNMNASTDIAKDVAALLKSNIRSLKLVDPRSVDKWIDENNVDEPADVGRALGADMVVVVELEDFSILLDQTLYQGHASYTLKVIDCKTGEVAFETTPPNVCWPPNSPVPTQEKSDSQFRKQFVMVLSSQIARHFYSYDPRETFAEDAMSFGK